jgi:drug/metabolite transporter (DMT)-like permease
MKARVSNLTAIFFALFAFTCWVLSDSCVKWVGQYGLPPAEIVAFMGFFMAVTLALQAAVRRRLGNLRPRSVVCQVLRGRHTSAGGVSQFHYTQLVSGALICYVTWAMFWLGIATV